MKRFIYYIVASWVVTFAVQRIGGSWGEGFLASLLLPPIFLIVYFVWKFQNAGKRIEREYRDAHDDPR